ncbi:hypothetical protein BJ170DRAFT_645604 [Xylariales sp. AK1849]|nr:hypothetical protein BJ170DRAFT_645604 [Xylariales sp. AK1849]
MDPRASKDVNPITEQFRRLWPNVIDDSNLTLHGFRRFKTTHLLNLRFLENEIAELDHIIYQAGLSLDHSLSSTDRLGLRNSRRDSAVPDISETITRELVSKVRELIKQYDEALVAFSNIMAMETVSLLDDEKQSSMRTDLTVPEMYKTRLVRVDLGTRTRTDPFQRWLHRQLRAFRYWRLSKRLQNNPHALTSFPRGHQWSHQNTVLIVNIAGRVVTAVIAGVFLVVPLSILSTSSIDSTQLVVVSVFILVFALCIAIMLKMSNYEMVVVSAAYAAILSVFVSNSAGT